MEVQEWMTRQVHCVRPLDSIQRAREMLETHRVNQLPVTVEGHLVGIVTDRDLRDAFPSVFDTARQPVRHGEVSDPDEITVETVMTPHVVSIVPDDTMAHAAAMMRRERIGALPVIEGNRLVGINTRSDVLEAFVALAGEPSPKHPKEVDAAAKP